MELVKRLKNGRPTSGVDHFLFLHHYFEGIVIEENRGLFILGIIYNIQPKCELCVKEAL